MRFTILLLLTLIFSLPQTWADPSNDYPESSMERRKEGFGSILGNDPETNKLQVFGKTIGESKKEKQESPKSTVGSNVSDYLWQAALDSVRSMPIVAIESKGGLIATDWHETERNTRHKFNILVLDGRVKVNAFKQNHKTDGWRDAKEGTDPLSNRMLNKIMSRAKELQSKQGK
jgi:hypothetical protein